MQILAAAAFTAAEEAHNLSQRHKIESEMWKHFSALQSEYEKVPRQKSESSKLLLLKSLLSRTAAFWKVKVETKALKKAKKCFFA